MYELQLFDYQYIVKQQNSVYTIFVLAYGGVADKSR
jgi:hypothetical protein